MSAAATGDAAFQERVLAGVSRTFALTIPQLPEALRPAIGNAYLLCRLADTIEDAAELDAAGKRARFRALIEALDAPDAAEGLSDALRAEVTGATQAEADLVRQAASVFRGFRGLPEEQRVPVRRCIGIMAAGMGRFESLKAPDGLAGSDLFRTYCYSVAGVVGEMLTDLFALHEPAVARQQTVMRQRAVAFGQGLQMTNILKDVWEDRRRGVCWLPRDVFERHGCTLVEGGRWQDDAGFRAGIGELVAGAHAHLREALAYTIGIPRQQAGIRRFCAWAIGMALHTLRNIHRNPGFTSAEQVKISRARVHATIRGCNLAIRGDGLLEAAFRWTARGLPAPETCHSSLRVVDKETPWTQTP